MKKMFDSPQQSVTAQELLQRERVRRQLDGWVTLAQF